LKTPGGLGSYPARRRSFPQGSVAAQALGCAATDNHGLAGLELQLDHRLAGKAGAETIVKDPFGRPIDVVASTPVREGRDVTLTIDHTIQGQAEMGLKQTMQGGDAKDAAAVGPHPRTRDRPPVGVEPGYDANAFGTSGPVVERNRAVTDTYEPGSTFKVVTVAGALSSRLVTPNTAFTLPYSIQVADRVIHDAEKRGTERFTVAQIL